MCLKENLTEDIGDNNKPNFKKSSSYDVWNKSMQELYEYFENSKIGLNSENYILIMYAIESFSIEMQFENTRLIIENIAENIGSKEYQGEENNVLLNDLLKLLLFGNQIIEDNLENICLICIGDKNIILDEKSELFSKLSIKSQRKLIDYIYNNIDKFERDNKIEFLKKNILKFIDKKVIFEKNNQLEEIVNSIVNENHLEYEQAKDLLKLIAFCNNIKSHMSKYQNEVNNLLDMEEKKFECFIKDLKELRKCIGIIPEEYCDYLIKQKIDSKSYLNRNLEEYFPFFKRCFEDKSQHILQSEGINSYVIQVTSELNKDTLGVIDGEYIKYSEEEVKDLSENNMHMINTMFHECRHALQRKHINDSMQINPNEYKMIKEEIIKREDTEYYNRNYIFMYSEIDARFLGAKGAYKYLKELGFENKTILDSDGQNFFECYREMQRIARDEYNNATSKIVVEGNSKKEEKVKSTFRKILEENLDLLKSYSVLSLEFNEEGCRKSGFEILRDYEDKLNRFRENPKSQNVNELAILSSILKERASMYVDTILEDIKELLTFNTDDNIVKRHRDHIIENEFLKTIRANSEGKTVYAYSNESEEEAKEHFNELVNNLYEFAKQNPEEPITKKILEEIEPYIKTEKDEQQSELAQLERIDSEVSDKERNEGMSIIIEASKTLDNNIEN